MENLSLRYAVRTSALLTAWVHDRFQKGELAIRHEVSARIAAEMFIKAFVGEAKFTSACWLINTVDTQVLKKCIQHITHDEPDPTDIYPPTVEIAKDAVVVAAFGAGPSRDNKVYSAITNVVGTATQYSEARRGTLSKLVASCLRHCREAEQSSVDDAEDSNGAQGIVDAREGYEAAPYIPPFPRPGSVADPKRTINVSVTSKHKHNRTPQHA